MFSKTALCDNHTELDKLLTHCDMQIVARALTLPAYVVANRPRNKDQLRTFGAWLFNQYRLFTLNKFALIVTKQTDTAIFEYANSYGYAWQEIWTNFYISHPAMARAIAHAEPTDDHQEEIDKVLASKDAMTTEDVLKKENGNPMLVHAGVRNTDTFIEWFNMRANEAYTATKTLLDSESPLSNDMFEWYVAIYDTYQRAITHLNQSGFIH